MSIRPISPTTTDRSSRLWRSYCTVAAFEAGVALFALTTVPREGSGFSAQRIGVMALLLIAFVGFGVAAWRPKPPSHGVRGVALAVAAALTILSAAALYVLRYLDPDILLPYFERLRIPLLYALALGLEAIAFLSVARIQWRSDSFRDALKTLPGAGLAWLVLLVSLTVVAFTRLGITPDPAYWGEPGVPILGWQLAIALLCGLLTLVLSHRFFHWRRLDLAIAASIWSLAVVAWLLVPLDVLRNSFYAPIGPPANVPFPNSDAGYYDSMAQSLLIGYPYQNEIPSRPLYVLFLAGSHMLLGQRYDLIIVVQTLILALIPVVLYWLGSAIHSRPAGVIAAVAAIGREWTSLVVSSATRVSNSKMLLVDLPTLLGVLACCLMIVRWVRQKDMRTAALSGGAFALLLLLRTQALALVPMVAVFVVLVLGIRRRSSYEQLAVFLGALVLTLAPWLIHNFISTGQLSLDAAFQYRIIASQYRYTGNLDIQNMDLEGKSMLVILLTFVARDPGFVFGFIVNHAVATLVGSVLALPLFHASPGLLAGVEPYWTEWNGALDGRNLALVMAYLALIALGLSSAWRRMRWPGLLPLILAVGYSLTNGIARFSGWRYDLPADWVAFFYLSAGVAEILLIYASLIGAARTAGRTLASGDGEVLQKIQFRALVPSLAALVLVGSLPWIAAKVATPRFAWASSHALVARLSNSPSMRAAGITRQDIADAQASGGAVMEIGRALYPRFFSRGTGLASAHPWPAYAPRDFPRLGFLLLNETRQDVLVPSRDMPSGLEHGGDAIILGCQREGYIEARLVLMVESDVLIRGSKITDPCE